MNISAVAESDEKICVAGDGITVVYRTERCYRYVHVDEDVDEE